MTRSKRWHACGLGVAMVAIGIILSTAVYWFLLSNARRGPLLQSVTPDSVWVLWDTPQPVIGQIEYGTSPAFGQTITQAKAERHHELQITGLNPYTRYYYHITGFSPANFRTAAAAGQGGFRFAVLGDTRENLSVHRAIVKGIVKAQPDFVLHTGDMVESGDCEGCWDDFFRIETPLLRSAPFFPTLGNHEDDRSSHSQSPYIDIFHLPGNERWYAFDYGNARFISLKADGYPEHVYFPEQEQLDWLEQQLAGNDLPWTIVFFHLGVFTSRDEGFLETGLRQKLAPLFERYGVEVVFMGHNHGYERVVVNGVTYLTVAGGGAMLYDFNQPEPGSRAAKRAYHFVLSEMNGDRLVGQAIDRSGKIIDQFELTPSP